MRESHAWGRGLAFGFLLGLTAGAALGLLYAPEKGKKTRRGIARRAERFGEKAENEVSGAPVVVNEEGTPVGVVTLSDVAGKATGRASVDLDRSRPEFFLRGWEDRYTVEEVRALRVEEESLSVRSVMTETLFTVAEDAPLEEIASVMVRGHVHRVLVTRDGRLVGIISSLDLLGAVFGRE